MCFTAIVRGHIVHAHCTLDSRHVHFSLFSKNSSSREFSDYLVHLKSSGIGFSENGQFLIVPYRP